MSNSIRKYGYYLLSIGEILSGFRNPISIMKCFLGSKPAGFQLIETRSGYQFYVRGKMDIWSVKEAVIDRFYEKYGFKIQKGWKIVDIGAGIGEFTVFASQNTANGEIIAFEPFPESHSLLEKNNHLNGAENTRAIQKAVSKETGQILLDLTDGEPLQFQSYEPSRNVSNREIIRVQCLSLKDVLDDYQIGICNLLKLDCEGAEYGILMYTSDEVIHRVERIVMEYHDVQGHHHSEISLFLEKKGFKVDVYQNPVHDHIGYLRAIQNNLL